MWRDPPLIQGIIFNIKIENAQNISWFYYCFYSENRRRGTHDHKPQRRRQVSKYQLFSRPGPPYPGPNPKNTKLPLDKTIIIP